MIVEYRLVAIIGTVADPKADANIVEKVVKVLDA